MSAIKTTRKIIEQKLSLLSVPIAYENVKFEPKNIPMYVAVQLRIQQPDDPVYGRGYHRERIEGQFFICSELNKGSGAAIDKAEQLRSIFFKGFSQAESGYVIHVLRTAQVASASITQDRYVVPVYVDFVTEVST
jgi:hypothetical protein